MNDSQQEKSNDRDGRDEARSAYRDFQSAAQYVLAKNAKLYRRLSVANGMSSGSQSGSEAK